jgi:hypothetical protein
LPRKFTFHISYFLFAELHHARADQRLHLQTRFTSSPLHPFSPSPLLPFSPSPFLPFTAFVSLSHKGVDICPAFTNIRAKFSALCGDRVIRRCCFEMGGRMKTKKLVGMIAAGIGAALVLTACSTVVTSPQTTTGVTIQTPQQQNFSPVQQAAPSQSIIPAQDKAQQKTPAKPADAAPAQAADVAKSAETAKAVDAASMPGKTCGTDYSD